MNITKLKIKNYKSIKDSGEIANSGSSDHAFR